MSRPRPPHIHLQVTRHDKVVWYFRIGRGSRTRLRATYGTPEFYAEYRAALEGRPVERKGKAAVGSLGWLLDRYRETTAWTGLSPATRRQRENIIRGALAQAGHEPATAIRRAHIVAGRDRRAVTPDQARHFLDTMRGLFRWALDAGYVKVDPTVGVKNPARPKGGGFPVWTEDEVARYAARWPIGTKERVWLDVLLYTGLRRGWQGGGMAALYTRAADRSRLAKGAMAKLARTEDARPIPSPTYQVRDFTRKPK